SPKDGHSAGSKPNGSRFRPEAARKADGMKALLTATAMATALSLTAPAVAQAPMNPVGSPPMAGPSPVPVQQPPSRINMPDESTISPDEAPAPRSSRRRATRRARHAGRAGSSKADNMADQLNRQELQRLPAAPGMAPAGPPPQGMRPPPR